MRTPRRPALLPGARGPRALLALGAALSVMLIANVLQVARLRRSAPRHRVALDHAATVGPVDGPPRSLLVLGDSAADGYGIADPEHALPFQVAAALAATGARVTVRSLATAGARTDDVLALQVPRLADTPPDVVVIGVGVNDALGRVPAARVRRRTAALLAAVADAAPAARVVLVPCPDLSAAPGLPAPLSWIVGWRCRGTARAQLAAAQDAGVAAVRWERRPMATEFGPDGFHPGVEGQRAVAGLILGSLERGQQVRSRP